MSEFTIVERTEPFTLYEVFDFIDDTNIGKTDAHELKSRIADMVQAERNKAIDEFEEKLYNKSTYLRDIESDDYGILHYEDVYEVSEELKEVQE